MFGMHYNPFALHQSVQIMTPGQEWPQPGAHQFYIRKSSKVISSETTKHGALFYVFCRIQLKFRY